MTGKQYVSIGPDLPILCIAVPLYALMFLKRGWSTGLGIAACLLMICGTGGWLIQIIQNSDGETTTHAIKTAAAIGCFLLAATGLLLRVARVNVNLGLDTGVTTHTSSLNLNTHQKAANPGSITRANVFLPLDNNTSTDTYHSLDQMPPELRAQVEQMLQKHGGAVGNTGHIPIHDTHIDITDDKYVVTDNISGEKHTYSNKEDLPTHVRRMLDSSH